MVDGQSVNYMEYIYPYIKKEHLLVRRQNGFGSALDKHSFIHGKDN